MSDDNPIAFKNEIIKDLTARTEKAEAALAEINNIRNSIIGLQTINWSEHIYPLVAALDKAGVEGMPYDEARPHYGTMLERTLKAEEVARARADAADAATAAKVRAEQLEKALRRVRKNVNRDHDKSCAKKIGVGCLWCETNVIIDVALGPVGGE